MHSQNQQPSTNIQNNHNNTVNNNSHLIQNTYNYYLLHIIEDLLPGVVVLNPMRVPSYPPVLHDASMQQDWDAFMAWHRKDAAMIHILMSRLSADVSAILPMVNDHGGAGSEYTMRTLLAILHKHFGLGQPVQAHATWEVLRTYTVDMQNVVKYVQRWHSTILSLHAECYPIIYFDAALNFMHNLPEEGGWYLPIHQDVTRDCGQSPDVIDFGYFDNLLDRVIDLDMQWHLSKFSNRTSCRKCDICSQQSHSTDQHDPSKQCAVDSMSNGHPPPCPANCPPDKTYTTPHANLADANPNSDSSEQHGTTSEEEVHAAVSKIPTSDCTVDTYNADKFFICTSASFLSPIDSASTWYLDVMHEIAYVLLAQSVKTLFDSGCTTHLFKEWCYFWSYHTDLAVDVKTANCGVLSTEACGEIRIHIHCVNGAHVMICLLDCLHAPSVPMNLISVRALIEWNIFLLFRKNWTTVITVLPLFSLSYLILIHRNPGPAYLISQTHDIPPAHSLPGYPAAITPVYAAAPPDD
ncbi:uncharacterized protein EV420DRAFT_1639248 [Desarmillaria tabescens]|uniref:Retrovirus-related Pol polyprotein from transposon TNT 1-94-like beta-barrel domain-containing protein n=1 Tax=Armillaria tabescens TaxID=1929756 RepID=A0AA39NCJ9_ARMTA|nr:uncharacterized protein EV420DRAFT_1639248 [Desarmillaria tabescens]KAK0463156.1 hypothetical protein EV420DRAFT_1639248 [Desarmillaria tabescens]